LSQNEVAAKLGCTDSAYCRYENGERELSINALIKLADLYNVSLDELVGRNAAEEELEVSFFDYMTGVENHINLDLAKSTGNKKLMQYVKDIAVNYDCVSMADAHRMVHYLEQAVDADTQILCKIFGVSRSGYYHFKKNGDVIKKKNEYIANLMLKRASGGVEDSGVIAVRDYLCSLEEYPDLRKISSERIRRIIDWFEIVTGELQGKKDELLNEYGHEDIADNDENRAYSPKWRVNITEINTGQGKLYMCAVFDSCYVVAYYTGVELNKTLVNQAISKAKANASTYMFIYEEPCIVYSGRREQVSPDDTESFFAALKCDYLSRFEVGTIATARMMIDRYVHYYNKIRVHECAGMPPFEYWRQGDNS